MKITLARISAALLTAGTLAVSGTSYAAGTASFAVSSASATTGSNTTVYISENGSNVSSVTVSYTYDTSKLQLVSSSCVGAFPNPIGSNTCYITPGNSPVNGPQSVMALTFKAVAEGSANVTVTGTQIASNGVNAWDGSSASNAISITAPAPQPAPSQPAQSSSSNSSSTAAGSSKSTSNASTGSTNTVTSKPAATSTGNTSSTSSAVKGTATNGTKKPVVHSNGKRSHTGLVTSSISLLVIAGAAVAWFMLHRNTEVVPAPKVYKLNSDTKTTKPTKAVRKASSTKKPAAKKRPATKKPAKKA